ncbi:MAG: NADPH:quinone oxidoreductase family protein [Thermoanaerobaculia bacterium]|nr:NADPH:quinone oxidoreductase family protein [Thermoanaerobaculia bacterium]
MKALICRRYSGYQDLEVGDFPDPTPGPGEILIDVEAAGLNFPDLLIVEGKYQFRPELPFVPGGECAGRVAAVGEGVERLRIGDRVVGTAISGAFAEKMVVPESAATPIPDGMDTDRAAGITITYATSYYALRDRAKLQPGETLLVLGAAGGVGLAAVELGKALGATVIAAASTEEKLAAAEAAGADLRILYTEEPLKERVKELTNHQGADVIFDPVGGAFSEQAFRAIAWEGRHLVVGFAAGDISKIPLNLALLKSAQIVGVFWGAWTQREPEASVRGQLELKTMFEQGRLEPRVTAMPLERYRDAYEMLADRRVIGKVVLQMASHT